MSRYVWVFISSDCWELGVGCGSFSAMIVIDSRCWFDLVGCLWITQLHGVFLLHALVEGNHVTSPASCGKCNYGEDGSAQSKVCVDNSKSLREYG